MKAYQLLSGALLLLTLTVSCAADPETLQPDRNERYAREFIKEFGVPDANHDYSMATSAGLKVTTAKGGHVMVTAEIDGTEYLFADLDVPAGTHPLPVTIPRSVTQLKVTTPYGEQLVATNATVNIDKMPSGKGVRASSRSFISEAGYPIISFKFNDFLKEYFAENPMGQDNKNIGFYDRTLQRNQFLFSKPKDNTPVYIFPIWWRSESPDAKDKNYKVYLNEDYFSNSELPNDERLLFGDGTSDKVPFPELCSISNPKISYTDIDMTKFPGNTIQDTGNNTTPYQPYSDAFTIFSRGRKFDNLGGVCMTIMKNDLNSISSSFPVFNAKYWNGRYFDVELSDLYTAMSSVKWTRLETATYHIYENNQWRDVTSTAIIVGFANPPSNAADKSIRDYSDVIFLILGCATQGHYKNPRPYEWTIAAEDLGGSDDWDFNDAVFRFTDVIQNLASENINYQFLFSGIPNETKSVRVMTVKPLAAGGTMPIYITYTGKVTSMPLMPSGAEGDGADMLYSQANQAIIDHMAKAPTEEGTFVLGKELHKWLGFGAHNSPINVGSNRGNHKAQEVKFVIHTDFDHNTIFDHSASTSIDNTPLNGFAILVDKNNELNIDAMGEGKDGFQLMPNHTLGQGSYMIGAPSEDRNLIAPQMILVDTDWEWPQERVNIKDAYPDFKTWINDKTIKWHTNQNQNKVTKK